MDCEISAARTRGHAKPGAKLEHVADIGILAVLPTIRCARDDCVGAHSRTAPTLSSRRSFRRAYSRPATEVEIEDSLEFLEQMRGEASQQAADEDVEAIAWGRLCHVIMAASEFLYVN